jgi:diguanylate cyclase (GGDEF)-like protein
LFCHDGADGDLIPFRWAQEAVQILKKLPIGVKFFGAFALILACMVLLATQAWRDVETVRSSVAELRSGPFRAVEAGLAAQRDFLQLRLLLVEHKAPDLPHIRQRLDIVRRSLDQFLRASTDQAVKSHAERAERLLLEWELVVSGGGNDRDRDRQLDQLSEMIQDDIDANVQIAQTESDAAVEHVEQVVARAAAWIAALGACTIALGLFAGLLVNDVLRHLGLAVGHARRIASGDLGKVIEVHRNDEPGQLLAALETMRSELNKQQTALERLATIDALTGLPNRRRLEEACQIQMARVKRRGEKLSVIMTDVDKFKSVNDTYGHQAGDLVLQHVAQILGATVRESDFVGRWGGEEFMVLCPDTKLTDAAIVAEKLRAAIAGHEFPVVGDKTASFGVAELALGEALEHAVERADAALYQAKEKGRNRVELAG